VVLQLGALATVDPLRGTISGMVYAPGGFLLFAAMGALCVTGSAMLAVSLVRFGSRKAAVAVGIWCVALAVAAVVPTDPPGATSVSLAALIHRDAAAVMFAAMPIAGLLVAAHPFPEGTVSPARQRAVRRASIAAAVMGVLQIAVSIPSLFPRAAVSAWPAVHTLHSVRGLAERALFLALLVVLVRIAAVVSRASALTAHQGAMRPRSGPLTDQVGVLGMRTDITAHETARGHDRPTLGAGRLQRSVHQRAATPSTAVLGIDLGVEHDGSSVAQGVFEDAGRHVLDVQFEAGVLRHVHHAKVAHTTVNG
jgi:hypothetical protein